MIHRSEVRIQAAYQRARLDLVLAIAFRAERSVELWAANDSGCP